MKITTKKGGLIEEENPFAMSIGDLMAALLLIFALLLSSSLLRIREQVDAYEDIKQEIYEDLNEKFRYKLDEWKAEIDPSTLTVKFREPKIYFAEGKSDLTPIFKEILNEFFPQYIDVLYQEKYKDHIEEIRIEGHTSSEWWKKVDLPPEKAFFLNMDLSQSRTRSVLEYCLSTIEINEIGERRSWVRGKIAAIGFSSSKLRTDATTKQELKEASRRVEFRVRTDAEARMEKMTSKIK